MNAWRTRLPVVLAALAALAAASGARAGAVFFAGQLKDGQFTPAHDVRGPCCTIRYSTISVKVDGLVAATAIEEVIAGPQTGTLRGLCLVPLPAGAEGASAAAAEGDGPPRPVAASFLPAEEARAVYEAVAKGTGEVRVVALTGRPALRIEDFELSAKTRLVVTFRQPVRQEGGVRFLECPMPATAFARGPVARLSLTAAVTSEKPLRAMFSPSHVATIERDGLRKALVRVTADNWAGRDDFRLCYVADEDDLGLRVLAHRPEDKEDGYFLLVGNPTGSVKERRVLPKDVVFVLDTSGSMRGQKIEQARAAIEYCLDHLNAGDRFNVVTFGTEVASFRGAPADSTKAEIEAAREFVDSAVAQGRTNISGALAKGLAGRPAKGRLRIMIFLTDGTPTAGEQVPEKIVESLPEMNASDTRIFVMGLGHDVNVHLLDKLAERTDGSAEYVEPAEDIDVKIASLYDRLSNPVLNDVQVAFGELRPTAVFPDKLPALFAGSEIMIAGRYRKGGEHTVTLRGTLAGEPVTYACRAELPDRTAPSANEFVAPLWAARKIGFLLREIRLNGESKELIEEIVRLSKKFGILTEYTDFLAAAGGTMDAGKAYEEAAGQLREARAQQSGQWAFNQAVNELQLQKRLVATGEANLYRDRRGRTVAADNIRQIGRQVFYLRDGQWVAADEPADPTVRRVKLFSEEYFDLLRTDKDFARAQSLGWNVEMNVGKERIAVEKDGQVRDESMRDSTPQQGAPRDRGEQRQQQIRQLNVQQLRNQIEQRPVPQRDPKGEPRDKDDAR